MSLTNTSGPSGIRGLGDLPEVPGFTTAGDALRLPTADGAWVKPARFWMVWNKHGGAPCVTHASEAKARREAVRLAKANPGQKFIVLAATDKFWVSAPAMAEAAE